MRKTINYIGFIAILCLLFCSVLRTQAQTSLSAGDIAFVGYNSAGSGPGGADDDFSFILLTPVTAGTTIHFTDFGWRTDAPAFQSANPCGPNTGAITDGAVTWTTTSALPCGTEVRIVCRTSLTASTGTVTGLQASFSNPGEYMSLGTGGESIFAFQGTLASPTLLAALNMNGGWDATVTNCTFSSAFSALPAALASYSLVKLPETDNARYNCGTVAQSPAILRAAILNNVNWNGTDGPGGVYSLPLGCAFGCSPVLSFSGGTSQSLSVCQDAPATSINSLLTVVEPNSGLPMTWSVAASPLHGTLNGFNYSTTSTGSNLTPTGLTYTPASGYNGPDSFTVQISNGTMTATTTIHVTVNPTPTVNSVSNQSVSNGYYTTAVVFSGAVSGTTYSWTNDAPSIGLAASGTGDITPFAAINNGVSPIVATITVTPTNAGCTGTPTIFTITVNPGTAPVPTSLAAGDILFIGYNSSGSGPGGNDDDFAFILLTDITPGTKINFTDFGWRTDTPSFQSANPCGPNTGAVSDGAITWTATSALLCGTQIRIVCKTALTASIGLVNGLQPSFSNPSEYMSLATGGESVFAFQGTLSAPSLLTALNMNGGWDATVNGCTFSSSISALPAALASYNLVITPERDNAIYNCTVTNQTPANLQAAILNNTNWNSQDAVAYTLPLACSFGCNANTAPSFTGGSPQSLTVCQDASATSINNLLTVAEPNSGQTITWSVSASPAHGTLNGFNYSTTSTGSNLTPAGLTYTPATGYSGPDAFTIQVSDGMATTTTTINVTVSPTPTVTTVVSDVLCNGGSDGAVTVSATGGVAPYTGTGTFTGLSSGTYTYIVTDANGCTTSATATVNEPTVLVASNTTTDVLCNGGSTGTVTVSATGGTLPYAGTGTFTGLSAGTYTYTVTDANGCTATTTATVNEPTALAASNTTTPVLCNGGSDGTVTVSATGGTPPYIGTGTFTGLSAGTYTYTVTDANGCTTTTSATVNQPTALVASNTTTSVLCNGSSDGTVTVSATGGTPPYTGTGTFTGLNAGTYTYTVTDANGCTTTTTATVNQPAPLVASSTVTNVLCNGGSTGTVTVSATGGTPPYTGTGTFTGLSAGTYTYTVTDANGCTATTTATISQASALSVSISVSPVTTVPGQAPYTIFLGYGPSSVTLTATPSGGTPGYTYSWTPTTGVANPTSASTSVSPTVTTTYTITITDANGCVATATRTIYVVDVHCCAGGSQNCNKVKVCHNGHTNCISSNAVSAHLAHGDMLGDCPAHKSDMGEEPTGETDEATTREIRIYPNPNNGNFFVEIPVTQKTAQIVVTDVSGRAVESKTVTDNNGTPIQFSLENAAPGIYFIKVNTYNNSTVTKMIVR